MIHRHRQLWGLTVWRTLRSRWVLWLCPAGECIPTHHHALMQATVQMLHGLMTWWKIEGHAKRCRRVDGHHRPVAIPAGVLHGAQAHEHSVFLVREDWLGPMRRSVTHDLIEA